MFFDEHEYPVMHPFLFTIFSVNLRYRNLILGI